MHPTVRRLLIGTGVAVILVHIATIMDRGVSPGWLYVVAVVEVALGLTLLAGGMDRGYGSVFLIFYVLIAAALLPIVEAVVVIAFWVVAGEFGVGLFSLAHCGLFILGSVNLVALYKLEFATQT